MTGSFYFMSIFKTTTEAGSSNEPLKNKPIMNDTLIIETIEPSPRTKERMRKVKSEEDFMKVQVPWIL